MQYSLSFQPETNRRGVVIDRLDVAVVLDSGEVGVGHAELFALIDVWRTFMHVLHSAKCLGRVLAMLRTVVTKPRDGPRLIMVVPIQRIPADIGESQLPLIQILFQRRQGNRS